MSTTLSDGVSLTGKQKQAKELAIMAVQAIQEPEKVSDEDEHAKRVLEFYNSLSKDNQEVFRGEMEKMSQGGNLPLGVTREYVRRSDPKELREKLKEPLEEDQEVVEGRASIEEVVGNRARTTLLITLAIEQEHKQAYNRQQMPSKVAAEILEQINSAQDENTQDKNQLPSHIQQILNSPEEEQKRIMSYLESIAEGAIAIDFSGAVNTGGEQLNKPQSRESTPAEKAQEIVKDQIRQQLEQQLYASKMSIRG